MFVRIREDRLNDEPLALILSATQSAHASKNLIDRTNVWSTTEESSMRPLFEEKVPP